MPKDGVEITGLVETQRMIRDLPRDLVRDGFPPALVAAGSVVGEALAANAPRRAVPANEGNREFAPLDQSVVVDVEVGRNGGVASVGFGESGPVALWDEYGHHIVTHSGRDTGKVTEPNPFMRRTTDQCANEAIDRFCSSLGNTVRTKYGR